MAEMKPILKKGLGLGIIIVSLSLGGPAASSPPVHFINTELLGRPADMSIAVNLMADEDLDAYFEFGLQPGSYSGRTATARFTGGNPIEAALSLLFPNTRYYYRLRYKRPGESDFLAGEERSFYTDRATGDAFIFDVEADPHLDGNSSPDLYRRTLQNILADSPDFLIDLGDTFFSEKEPVITWETVVARHLLLRTYFDPTAHSVPLFCAIGNHEGEWGSRLNGTENNLAVWATRARKLYYPNPVPDQFYTGNSSVEPFVGIRQDYYAWEWGQALFVVLDPYWYTTVKPTTDNWTMTLGDQQYMWLKNVLAASGAKFKFVFCHQLVGGNGKDGRGGTEYAPFFEWGGKNSDGSWGFSDRRPGWDKPIHQLMAETGVTIFFHGHDHFFAKQNLDGIVYQLVPQPSHPGEADPRASDYGYIDGIVLGGSGHLRVSVLAKDVIVEFVRARLPEDETTGHPNGEVAFSYSIKSKGKKGGIR
jgi:hypothetical protein